MAGWAPLQIRVVWEHCGASGGQIDLRLDMLDDFQWDVLLMEMLVGPHHLHRVLLRRVGHGLAEGGVNDDIDISLFLYLAHCCLYLGLACFDVSLREGPVTAVDMLYQQYLGIAVIFTINNSSA